MLRIIPDELKILAGVCPAPLYLVGGSVRDYLARLTPSIRDWDICSPMPADKFAEIATANGFCVQAVYANTGTVKLKGTTDEYEYSCFRHDKYVRGTHVPSEIYFTDDIRLDARRRDFTANAVYFDIARHKFVDPLNGIDAIAEKRLTTVAPANKVFGEDGLRLMRLARQAAQLDFSPDEECLKGAQENAALIADISPERIFEELTLLLTADKKCGVAGAPERGLRLLDEIGVLDYILPELAKGKNVTQRADFHKYDVLEHSFRAVRYMEDLDGSYALRLAALLHDVGKPACILRDGNAHAHCGEGERLALKILYRLKTPKKILHQIVWLIKWHMYDYNCQTNEGKLRRFLAENYPAVDMLLKIKQADFSACADDTSVAPTCARWTALLAQMKAEGVPFYVRELAVDGNDLMKAGITPAHISTVLKGLWMHAVVSPNENTKKRLIKLACGMEKGLRSQ